MANARLEADKDTPKKQLADVAKLKVHQCRFENLPIPSSSYKNNKLNISHLKYLLLFEICAREICEKFIYKHSEIIEYAKN